MLFCTGPVFQASAGLAEIEMHQGICRILSEVGLKGLARLLELLLFQEILSRGNFLAPVSPVAVAIVGNQPASSKATSTRVFFIHHIHHLLNR